MPDPVTLDLKFWFISPALQAAIDAFHEEYPWITIQTNTSIQKAVINNVIAGEKSDLVILDNGLDQWITGDNDLLVDLAPFIEQDERIQNADVVEGFMDSFFTPDGKVYTLPWTDIPMFVAVNKDLLRKYGMEMPSNDWTYDEMLNMMIKATNKDANDWGLIGTAALLAELRSIANGNTANFRWMNEDLTQSVLNRPEVIADLQWGQDLLLRYNVEPTADQKKELGVPGDPGAAFLNGNFLFFGAADWNISQLQGATFDWDVLPFPRGIKSQVTQHQVGPMSIVKSSEHIEEAFMFMSFLFSEKPQIAAIDNGAGAWVKSPAIDTHFDKVALWEGKNVEAIKLTSTLCCYGKDIQMVNFTDYVFGGALAKANALMSGGGNFSELIPLVEDYNRKVAETRAAMGW